MAEVLTKHESEKCSSEPHKGNGPPQSCGGTRHRQEKMSGVIQSNEELDMKNQQTDKQK